MAFNDRISSQETPPDLALLKAQYAALCAHLIAAVIHPETALTIAYQLRRHVRGMIQASQGILRRRQKIDMLLQPAWRERVILELGGWGRLKRWTKRQAKVAAASADTFYTRPIYPLTPEEASNRKDIREVLKRNAHPLILRDPFRVDFDGWFCLPSLPKLSPPRYDHPLYSDAEYEYDPRAKANFSGINAPITVWPEEFRAAAQIRPFIEAEVRAGHALDAAVYADASVTSQDERACEGRRRAVDEAAFLSRCQPNCQTVLGLRRGQIRGGRRVMYFCVRGPPRRSCRAKTSSAAPTRRSIFARAEQSADKTQP